MRKLYEKCLSQTQFSVLNFEQIFQLSQKRLKRELKAELIANGYTVQNRKAFICSGYAPCPAGRTSGHRSL